MNRRWLTLLLSPVGILLISAGRLLIISNYNSTTATTVASSGGYVNTLLGSVIPLVPLFIPYVALLLLLFRQFMLGAIALVFTAFIAPTSLILPVTRELAIADKHQLFARVDANRAATLLVATVIFIFAYIYFRSFPEALASVLMLAVALELLATPVIKDLYVPRTLRLAISMESDAMRIFARDVVDHVFPGGYHAFLIYGSIAFCLLFVVNAASGIQQLAAFVSSTVTAAANLITLLIALLVTFAFFPYIYNIYPIPHQQEYYVGVLRTPWLPAEKFELSSGRNYYGYALSEDQDWFTVLLSRTRKIIYLPTHEILARSVCETRSQEKVPMEKPLITTFYVKPSIIPPCANVSAVHRFVGPS